MKLQGLNPKHIGNHGQLNEWELANIVQAERWAFSRKHPDLPGHRFRL